MVSGIFGESLSGEDYHRYLRVQIARETGWTLETIDGLSLQNWADVVAVIYGLQDVIAFKQGIS